MRHPEQQIRLRGSARSDTGRVRDNNEDSIYLWTQHDEIVIATVADGMGGAVAGEEASRIAVEAIQTGLVSGVSEDIEDFARMDQEDVIHHLKAAIRSGNIDIINTANARPELKGMGTTITMALIRGSHVIIGHVGDSRAYLVNGDDSHIMQITADHSFVQALVAAGHITAEEADDHPMKNVLYRALGQAQDLEIDIYYEMLQPGDRLVLCSDGLTLHVKPHEIARMCLSNEEPSHASEDMVNLANKRGGRDNVSVIVIKAEAVADSTLALDADQMVYDEYDDEETIVTPGGFGPMESAGSPPTDQRDGRPQSRREPPGTFSTTQTAPAVKHPDEESTNSDLLDTLGEGTDIYRPDQ